MGEKKRCQDGVPEYLQQKTIETLPLEKPYVMEPPEFGSLREVCTIDSASERLMTDVRESVRPLETEDLGDQENTIIVMRVLVRDNTGGEGGQLIEGLVADTRWCKERFHVSTAEERQVDFTDQEYAWGQIDTQKHEVPFVAVIAYDEDGEIDIWGDPRFYDAAQHLVALVDEYRDDEDEQVGDEPEESAEEDVAAIEQEVFGGVSDAASEKKPEPVHRKIAKVVLGRLFGGRSER